MGNEAHKKFDCNISCSVEQSLYVISRKWIGSILYHLLLKESLRESEIKKIFPEISQKTLTKQLRYLEESGIVERRVFPETPPKVTYSLTKFGLTLKEPIFALKHWGDFYKKYKIQRNL